MNSEVSVFPRFESAVTPWLWELNDKNQAVNEVELLASLAFFKEQPDWVNQNPEVAKRCFIHLTKTNLSAKTENLVKASKIKKSLKKLHPDFFPTVEVQIGTEKKRVSQHLLIEKSEKFAQSFCPPWKEHNERVLDITVPEGMDQSVQNSFMQFLKNGHVELTVATAVHLLRFAQEHFIPELSAYCNEFLCSSLEISLLPEMLELAIKYNVADLKWQCLVFASQNSENEEFIQFFERYSADASKEAVFILEQGMQCKKHKIEPRFMGAEKIRTVGLDYPLDDTQFLKGIVDYFTVAGLRIQGGFARDKTLFDIEGILKKPQFLLLKSTNITCIPEKWLDSVREIDCSFCTSLTTLKVPLAKKVTISNCSKLNTLIAPDAKKIDCTHSPLSKLNAPVAEIVLCSNSHIVNLHVPLARKIIGSNCPHLKDVFAPMAREINCDNCPELTRLICPAAKTVCCTKSSLTSLEIPIAEHVACRNNKLLLSLNAPMAYTVDVDGCSKLSRLDVPKARNVTCSNTSIQWLDALMAEEINCAHSELTSLEVPHAKKINCSHTLIRKLDAPNVEEIDCSFTRLEQVDAPKAKRVKSVGCPQLSSLIVPAALEVACSNCPKLSNLIVSMCEELSCRDCVGLKWLNAPKARTINSSRCGLLERIDAPIAETIICPDCCALSVLNASLVREMNVDGCTTLMGSSKPESVEAINERNVKTSVKKIIKALQRLVFK